MKLVTVSEQVFQSSNKVKNIDLKPEDKILAVLFRNQGGVILRTGMNAEKPQNKTLPGGSMPYGVDGAYLVGTLYIDFEAAGGEAVAVIYKDSGEANNC